jgi:hypothetical protein
VLASIAEALRRMLVAGASRPKFIQNYDNLPQNPQGLLDSTACKFLGPASASYQRAASHCEGFYEPLKKNMVVAHEPKCGI